MFDYKLLKSASSSESPEAKVVSIPSLNLRKIELKSKVDSKKIVLK